jgi:excisionase family DNA binding protein
MKTLATPVDRVWFNTAEAAAYCRMSTRHLLRLAKRGAVRGEQIAQGGHWRFHRDWLDALLAGDTATVRAS